MEQVGSIQATHEPHPITTPSIDQSGQPFDLDDYTAHLRHHDQSGDDAHQDADYHVVGHVERRSHLHPFSSEDANLNHHEALHAHFGEDGDEANDEDRRDGQDEGPQLAYVPSATSEVDATPTTTADAAGEEARRKRKRTADVPSTPGAVGSVGSVEEHGGHRGGRQRPEGRKERRSERVESSPSMLDEERDEDADEDEVDEEEEEGEEEEEEEQVAPMTTRQIMERLAEKLGKKAEEVEPFTERLEREWFSTVDQLRTLSDEVFERMQFPLGLVLALRREIDLIAPLSTSLGDFHDVGDIPNVLKSKIIQRQLRTHERRSNSGRKRKLLSMKVWKKMVEKYASETMHSPNPFRVTSIFQIDCYSCGCTINISKPGQIYYLKRHVEGVRPDIRTSNHMKNYQTWVREQQGVREYLGPPEPKRLQPKPTIEEEEELEHGEVGRVEREGERQHPLEGNPSSSSVTDLFPGHAEGDVRHDLPLTSPAEPSRSGHPRLPPPHDDLGEGLDHGSLNPPSVPHDLPLPQGQVAMDNPQAFHNTIISAPTLPPLSAHSSSLHAALPHLLPRPFLTSVLSPPTLPSLHLHPSPSPPLSLQLHGSGEIDLLSSFPLPPLAMLDHYPSQLHLSPLYHHHAQHSQQHPHHHLTLLPTSTSSPPSSSSTSHGHQHHHLHGLPLPSPSSSIPPHYPPLTMTEKPS